MAELSDLYDRHMEWQERIGACRQLFESIVWANKAGRKDLVRKYAYEGLRELGEEVGDEQGSAVRRPIHGRGAANRGIVHGD